MNSRTFAWLFSLAVLCLSPGVRWASAETDQALVERVKKLEEELQKSRARERKLEERLERLEGTASTPPVDGSKTAEKAAESPAAAVSGGNLFDQLGKDQPPATAAEQTRAAHSEPRADLASPVRDWERKFYEGGTLREVIFGGFDFQGFVDARFIFDEDVLFDHQETFNFHLQQVELDLIKRFPRIVSLRADVDFAAAGVSLEQGYVDFAVPIGRTLGFRLGKFNSPIGTEGPDAPSAIFINPSLVHALALPENYTGAMFEYPFFSSFRVYAVIANGWDLNDDYNQSKSLAGRLEWKPLPSVVVGLSGGHGSEENHSFGNIRRFVVLDGIFTPLPRLDLTFDITYGTEDQATVGYFANGFPVLAHANWWGGQATVLYRVVRWFDIAGRYEFFQDDDSARLNDHLGVRTLVTKFSGASVQVNAFSGGFLFHVVDGADFNIEYQYNYSSGQDFRGLDGFLNHQENVVTFQAEAVF